MHLEELLYRIDSQEEDVKEQYETGLEFKASWNREHGKEVAALANNARNERGFLLVRVSDEGKVIGEDEKWAEETELRISNHLREFLDPVQACKELNVERLNKGCVVVLKIENPGDVVYWNHKAYKRVGTSKESMTPEEIVSLRYDLPGLDDFSARDTDVNPDEDLVAKFLTRVEDEGYDIPSKHSSPGEALGWLGINGTQASRILFGECPFRFVVYGSDQKPDINVKRYGLFTALTREFREEIQGRAESLTGKDMPYASRALKEAIANAVAHSAFFENDGEVTIEVYRDRLVVSNLCIRGTTYFANKWFSRGRKAVNSLLMEVLRMAGFVDSLGLGKKMIFSEVLKKGKRPPQVYLERAGRYSRWKLELPSGVKDDRRLRLLERCRQVYDNEEEALMSMALVLWRERGLEEVAKYVDDEYADTFARVLVGSKSPVSVDFSTKELKLKRWAEVLIGEGQDSKKLSKEEEQELEHAARQYAQEEGDGMIAPKDLRRLAGMGNSSSERTQSSRILKRWEQNGKVEKVRHGKYAFSEKIDLQKLEEFMSRVAAVLREEGIS